MLCVLDVHLMSMRMCMWIVLSCKSWEIHTCTWCRSSAGLSGGAKAGIAIAVLVGVFGIAVLLGLYLPRYRRSARGWEKQELDGQFPLQSAGTDVEMSNGHRPVRGQLQ